MSNQVTSNNKERKSLQPKIPPQFSQTSSLFGLGMISRSEAPRSKNTKLLMAVTLKSEDTNDNLDSVVAKK